MKSFMYIRRGSSISIYVLIEVRYTIEEGCLIQSVAIEPNGSKSNLLDVCRVMNVLVG